MCHVWKRDRLIKSIHGKEESKMPIEQWEILTGKLLFINLLPLSWVAWWFSRKQFHNQPAWICMERTSATFENVFLVNPNVILVVLLPTSVTRHFEFHFYFISKRKPMTSIGSLNKLHKCYFYIATVGRGKDSPQRESTECGKCFRIFIVYCFSFVYAIHSKKV